MKIIVKTPSSKARKDWDHREYIEITSDGESVFYAHDGEPEDRFLSGDFNDCYNIPKLMELAYLAGKAGEEFVVERIEADE